MIDVIKKAGGLTKNACTDDLNLSKKIKDEMLIVVSSKTSNILDFNPDDHDILGWITLIAGFCAIPLFFAWLLPILTILLGVIDIYIQGSQKKSLLLPIAGIIFAILAIATRIIILISQISM